MARSGFIAWLTLILVAVAGALAPSASAASPTIERINIDDTFVDQISCGFTVTIQMQGFIIFRNFSDKRISQLETSNIAFTATGPTGNSVTAKDVGADLTHVMPGPAVVASFSGQETFGFTGVLKINWTTDEVILEPQHTGDIEEFCASLAA
jgi:hypothetical protein